MRSYSLRVLAERPFTQVAAVHRWMKTAAMQEHVLVQTLETPILLPGKLQLRHRSDSQL